MKTILAIFLLCFFVTVLATGHEERDARLEAIYPFKQQAYDLCIGHGLMHLSDEEMRDLCVRLARNLDDVRELQKDAKNDKFLAQLTGLIIRSEIPENVKHNLLRRSYEISKEKSSQGDEWHFTVVVLIETGNVLSTDEISSHISSTNAYLKGTATRYLEKNSERDPKRPERKTGETNSDAKAVVKGTADPDDGSRSGSGRWMIWGGWIAGAIVIGLLSVFFMARKSVSPP